MGFGIENTPERRLMLCGECGRYYWVQPTGEKWEWRVILATGETVVKMVAAEPTLQNVIDGVLGKAVETNWYMATFTPVQIQASVDPLCHITDCVISPRTGGRLEETYLVL